MLALAFDAAADALMILGDEFKTEGVERSDPHFDGGVRVVGGQALAHFMSLVARRSCRGLQ